MYCLFSKYKNILGVPGKGVHKYQFLDTAIVDYIFTILGAIITTYFIFLFIFFIIYFDVLNFGNL